MNPEDREKYHRNLIKNAAPLEKALMKLDMCTDVNGKFIHINTDEKFAVIIALYGNRGIGPAAAEMRAKFWARSNNGKI